ncbi:neural cell adhesion molecule 1-like isoform X2 [Bolinopsis microptera]|uniref:neural cell adhesion molecule 1-like isoform X2 n=1 Tax=Bolinopsis microptera TaxID=2820187 RepID=UPI00307943FA
MPFLLYILALLLPTSLSVPFFFKDQPQDMVLQEGEEARLYCIVDPLPAGATFTWYKSDEFKVEESVIEEKLEPLSEFQTSVLSYMSVSRDATGYYHCKVQTTEPAYRIFSSTAHVVVNYFDSPADTIVSETVTLTDNKPEAYLECDIVTSSPEMDVTWKKNGQTIADKRMFVFPEKQFGARTVERGTLLIMNVDMDKDAGLYECYTVTKVEVDGVKQQLLLSSYQVKTSRGFDTPKDLVPIPLFESFSQTGGAVEISLGSRVTLICAARGFPTPEYDWFMVGASGEVAIRGSDSLLLEDNNKRLVASNIDADTRYKCVMSNSANGRENERETNFYITITEAPADYSITVTQIPAKNHVLKPNQYTPFTLECYVEKTGQNQILWLKNGEKMKWNARFTTDYSDKEIDGVMSKGSTLTFETSNESDIGVYQCVIVNSKSLKTETAYVTLEKDSLSYDIDSRQPKYFYLAGPYHVDEAEEACNNEKAHLVSILDEKENSKVQQLAAQNSANSVWIGLTREVPEPVGSWAWTLSEDTATTFSNWDNDKPDNKYGAQEYTVMSQNNGKWVDVNKNMKRPAVCKKYEVVCRSIDESYRGRVRARGWESVGATYEVGQQVEVFCRFPGEKALSVTAVTCGQNREFSPEISLDECPQVDSSTPSLHISSILLIITLIIRALRTS